MQHHDDAMIGAIHVCWRPEKALVMGLNSVTSAWQPAIGSPLPEMMCHYGHHAARVWVGPLRWLEERLRAGWAMQHHDDAMIGAIHVLEGPEKVLATVKSALQRAIGSPLQGETCED